MSTTIGEQDTQFNKLVELLKQELRIAQETIERSPLLQALGKPAQAHVTRNTNYLKDRGLSGSERHALLEKEAADKGVELLDLLYDHTIADATYWPLQLSSYVFVANDGIRTFGKDGILWPSVAGMQPQDEIENIIQSLRLLCSPANGGVAAE